MLEVKLLIAVGNGKIHTVTLSNDQWEYGRDFAHRLIDRVIEQAMEDSRQDAREAADLAAWERSGTHARVAYHPSELPQRLKEAISKAQMNVEHIHLNSIISATIC